MNSVRGLRFGQNDIKCIYGYKDFSDAMFHLEYGSNEFHWEYLITCIIQLACAIQYVVDCQEVGSGSARREESW